MKLKIKNKSSASLIFGKLNINGNTTHNITVSDVNDNLIRTFDEYTEISRKALDGGVSIIVDDIELSTQESCDYIGYMYDDKEFFLRDMIEDHLDTTPIHFNIDDINGLVVSGGDAGQVLTKTTSSDYDYVWDTPSGGGESSVQFVEDDGHVDNYTSTGKYYCESWEGSLPVGEALLIVINNNSGIGSLKIEQTAISPSSIHIFRRFFNGSNWSVWNNIYQNIREVLTQSNDAGNKQIKNVANGTDPQDVVTISQLNNVSIYSTSGINVTQLSDGYDITNLTSAGFYSITNGVNVPDDYSKSGEVTYIQSSTGNGMLLYRPQGTPVLYASGMSGGSVIGWYKCNYNNLSEITRYGAISDSIMSYSTDLTALTDKQIPPRKQIYDNFLQSSLVASSVATISTYSEWFAPLYSVRSIDQTATGLPNNITSGSQKFTVFVYTKSDTNEGQSVLLSEISTGRQWRASHDGISKSTKHGWEELVTGDILKGTLSKRHCSLTGISNAVSSVWGETIVWTGDNDSDTINLPFVENTVVPITQNTSFGNEVKIVNSSGQSRVMIRNQENGSIRPMYDSSTGGSSFKEVYSFMLYPQEWIVLQENTFNYHLVSRGSNIPNEEKISLVSYWGDWDHTVINTNIPNYDEFAKDRGKDYSGGGNLLEVQTDGTVKYIGYRDTVAVLEIRADSISSANIGATETTGIRVLANSSAGGGSRQFDIVNGESCNMKFFFPIGKDGTLSISLAHYGGSTPYSVGDVINFKNLQLVYRILG